MSRLKIYIYHRTANVCKIDLEILNGFIYIPFRSNSISALHQGDTDSIGKWVIFDFKPQFFFITYVS